MPIVLIETMNGTPERNNSNGFGSMKYCITRALGQPQRIVAYNTCQIKDYSRYELGGFVLLLAIGSGIFIYGGWQMG